MAIFWLLSPLFFQLWGTVKGAWISNTGDWTATSSTVWNDLDVYRPWKATDADDESFFISGESDPFAWLLIDLAKTYKIARVSTKLRNDQSYGLGKRFTDTVVSTSPDGIAWTECGRAPSSGLYPHPVDYPMVCDEKVSARYVKYARTSWGYVQVAEVAIFQEPCDPPEEISGYALSWSPPTDEGSTATPTASAAPFSGQATSLYEMNAEAAEDDEDSDN